MLNKNTIKMLEYDKTKENRKKKKLIDRKYVKGLSIDLKK